MLRLGRQEGGGRLRIEFALERKDSDYLRGGNEALPQN